MSRIYSKADRYGSSVYFIHEGEGQSVDRVSSILSGMGCINVQILQKIQYDAEIALLNKPVFVDAVSEKSISDAKNKSKTADERLNALVTVVLP